MDNEPVKKAVDGSSAAGLADRLARAVVRLARAGIAEEIAKSYVKPHTRRLKSGKVVQVKGYQTKRQARREPAELRWGDARVGIDRRNRARWWHPTGEISVKLTDEQADELRRIMRGEHQPYRAPYPPAEAAALRIKEWHEEAQDRAAERAMERRLRKSLGALSASDVEASVREALKAVWSLSAPEEEGQGKAASEPDWWVCALYEGYAIVERGGKKYRVPYAVEGTRVVLTGQPVAAVQQWVPVEEAEPAPLLKSYRKPARGSSAPLGTGARFAALERKLARRGDIQDPAALAAAIGRKKYGKERFQELAAAGRRRKGRKRRKGAQAQ